MQFDDGGRDGHPGFRQLRDGGLEVENDVVFVEALSRELLDEDPYAVFALTEKDFYGNSENENSTKFIIGAFQNPPAFGGVS